jgi:hypothetical protein
MTESYFNDIARTATLSSGQIIHGFHKSTWCLGVHCPVHKPSDHEYRKYDLRFNFSQFVFERVIPEGEEFPFVIDPDDYTLAQNGGKILYRHSVRCKNCGDDIQSHHRNDYESCSCGRVSIVGGNTYPSVLADPEDYIDTSIWFENGKFVKKEVAE